MVTQSGGPWIAARMGMVLAAEQVRGLRLSVALQKIENAAYILSHARPTTSEGMIRQVNEVSAICIDALKCGVDPVYATHTFVLETLDSQYESSRRMATCFVDLLSDAPTIMTQCFAETLIGFILLVAKERGKEISLLCPETRPYLQGARLTASVAVDTGIPVTVITDNMPAYVLSQGKVEAVIAAADVITMDGYVVNKIGTFQIALAAHHFDVPFYIIGNPNPTNPTIDTVHIEERDPEETLYAMGVRTAKEGVKGYYPAFDITPPEFIKGIVTRRGLLSPYKLKE
jgi:methylthioribose-1-phosphate isomerase